MGLGPNFIPSLSMGQQPLNDQRNGPYFSPILSGPSTYEVGERSKAGQASLVPKLAVARQCLRIPELRAILIADGVCLFGLTLTTKGQEALTLWSVSFLQSMLYNISPTISDLNSYLLGAMKDIYSHLSL